MADTDHLRLLPWLAGGIAAVVGALWAAVRGAHGREVARLETAITHERAERERERVEAREALSRLGAKLDAERGARGHDQRRTARALYRASGDPSRVADWDDMPTGVHDLLTIASDRSPELDRVDRLLKRADDQPASQWSDSTPPDAPRKRVPSRSR